MQDPQTKKPTTTWAGLIKGDIALYNYTDQSATSIINNPLQGVLQFQLSVFRHTMQFVLNSFPNQIMQGFAKYIGFPNLGGIFFELIQHIAYQFLTLFFGSYYRRNLSCNISPDYVEGWGFGF
jgi:hypothetical protein